MCGYLQSTDAEIGAQFRLCAHPAMRTVATVMRVLTTSCDRPMDRGKASQRGTLTQGHSTIPHLLALSGQVRSDSYIQKCGFSKGGEFPLAAIGHSVLFDGL